MTKLLLSFLLLCCISGASHASRSPERAPTTHLNVLQMNIWQEGTSVEGGFEAIADEIVQSDADVVFLSEVRNYHGKNFIPRIRKALQSRGKTYYGEHSTLDVGILSKYPIEEQQIVYPTTKGAGNILRATFRIGSHTVAAYSAHLNYTDYACYLPRGYSGTTWKKLKAPVSDADSVLTANRLSYRDESIREFLQVAQKDIAAGYIILLGGDFNEPSHLDWQADTKDLWDHNGLIVNWDCSAMLYEKGFRDAYRELHPHAVTHPGFTFPSDNKHAPVSKLSWAPDADERDRIDFIYYYPRQGFKPKKAMIVGPDTSIVRSQRVKENSKDCFRVPLNVWPSDHKAVWVTFCLQ